MRGWEPPDIIFGATGLALALCLVGLVAVTCACALRLADCA